MVDDYDKERTPPDSISLTAEQKEWLMREGVIGVMLCPHCGELSVRVITWDESYDMAEETRGLELSIASCVSGGVYKVGFYCPNCRNEIEMY